MRATKGRKGWFRAGLAAVLLLIGAASPAIGSRSIDVETSTSVSLGPSTNELLKELASGDFEYLEHEDRAPIRLALTAPESWPYSDLQVETRLKGQKLDRYLETLGLPPLSATASRVYGFYARPPASGVCVGPNQYQFALNSPYNFSDPTGELAWCLAAGGAGVLAGKGISSAMGEEYSLAEGALDFAIGAATCGVGSWLKHGAKVAGKTLASTAARKAMVGGVAETAIVGTAETARYALQTGEYDPLHGLTVGGISSLATYGLPVVGPRLARWWSRDGRRIPGGQFEALTGDFADNVTSGNFRAWKQGLLDQGIRADTIQDIVHHGSLKKGHNIWGEGWKRYYSEISGTQFPAGQMTRAHAHHLAQKAGGGTAGALNRKILEEVGIDPLLSRHNLAWAPNIAGQHGLVPQSELLKTLLPARNNRKAVIEVLGKWAAVSRGR